VWPFAGLLDTWGDRLTGFLVLLATRLVWWLWRRGSDHPVPFLGRAISRICDGIAALILAADTFRGLYLRAVLAESQGRRKDIQIAERDHILAVALTLLADQGISQKDLELLAGSADFSALYDGLILPTLSPPNMQALSRNTLRRRAKSRRNRP
jgi:hypothetical protein